MRLSDDKEWKEENLVDLEKAHFENVSEAFFRRIFLTREVFGQDRRSTAEIK